MERPVLMPLRAGALVAAAAVAAAALAVQLVPPARAIPTELFLSEYVEGSSSNKALEVFNGTGAPVTLTGSYDVQIFANGSPTATATIPLVGTVASGDVFVLAQVNAVAAILAQADQTTTNFLFNGDDAVALRRDGAIVDVIGQIGVDPGAEWGSGDASTADATLRRKASVQAGDADGSDAFEPAGGWNGFPLDSFDGLGAHSITVGPNGPPTSADDVAVTDEDAAVTIDVLANDADPDADPLAVVAVGEPENGVAEVAADGTAVVYAPDVDFAGEDSFTYTVADGAGGEATATVRVSVEAVNDDPEPEDDAASTLEDVAVTIEVLANDTDPDGDGLAVTAAEGAEHGSVTVSPGGAAVVYAPDSDWHGEDAFEYTVADGAGGIETAEVVVAVAAVNDAPRPGADLASVAAGASVVVDVLANDAPGPADEAGQTLVVASVGAPASGTAELVTSGPDAGKVRYTPQPGFRGTDAFSYVVSDGDATATGNVTVAVRAPRLTTLCGLPPTIVGTRGDDVVVGTPGDDVIKTLRGADVVDGAGGNDVVCAGPGADRVTTLGGDDHVAGGTGSDTVDAGAGEDRVRGGFGRDAIAAGPGDDAVAAGPGADEVDAGDGRNRVAGGLGDDSLRSGSGPDRLDGGPGTDACDPGGGRNRVLRCE